MILRVENYQQDAPRNFFIIYFINLYLYLFKWFEINLNKYSNSFLKDFEWRKIQWDKYKYLRISCMEHRLKDH